MYFTVMDNGKRLNIMCIFRRYLSEIESEIQKDVRKLFKDYEQLWNMVGYCFGWVDQPGNPIVNVKFRGKRFRPLLCLLVCESICGEYKHALPAAAAIEIFHNYSLIHDDIIDKGDYRRWRSTPWKVFGISHSINTGDAMSILAQLLMCRSYKIGVSKVKTLEIAEILNQAFLRVFKGQHLDISYENEREISMREYLEMVKNKSAVLIGAACELGARLARGDQRIINSYRNFGINLGIAYQIYNDVQEIWAGFEKTGKRLWGDIKKKKKTLPIIYAFRKLSRIDKNRLIAIYRKRTLNRYDIKKIAKFLDKTNSYNYAKQVILRYKQKALRELKKINVNTLYKNRLLDLTEHLVELKR